ncbi:MAG: 2-isopropylmalate synthase [Chloroflexi bacterium]|nr:2-isopropylmalate synthase [Chloroflexota bacterium]
MLNPDKVHRREGSFWVSTTNFDPEVTAEFSWPDPFLVIDSTLRKMLFTAGALTSIDGFVRVAEALAEAGIKHESLNINWAGGRTPIPRGLALVKAIAGRDFGFELNVYADTLLSDGERRQPVTARETAELLAEHGVRTLGVGIVQAPSADAQARQMDELAAYFETVRELGLTSTVTLARAGWRGFDSLVAVSNEAIALGATRMDLMDSSSSLSPEAMKVFVRRYRQGLISDVPVTMHMHDDFGLATAGAIAAATAGASPDVSVAGVSYRCGFAPLEEVIVSLEVLYGVDTGIKVDRLQPLADLVAAEMGVPIPPLKPLVGQYAYLRHMPGDVLACLKGGLDQFPAPAACVHPSVIGSQMTWVWDALTTDANVRALAATIGETLAEDEVPAVRAALDGAVDAITTYPRWLTAEQATEICRAAIREARRAPAR